MTNKLFVGGLPYRTSEAELQAHFEQAGEVLSVAIITDRDSGRSKGFGFVEMADEAGMQAAIDQFNGNDFDGRRLTVGEARPKRED
jgi:RNA recognition motif-containing protein